MTKITEIPMNQIVPGNNDRTIFDSQAIQSLAKNIGEIGLISSIVVREMDGTDLYQIVAGERRFRACQLLGWQSIPSKIADLTDAEASAVMLAENVSRSDLDPIDEANAYVARMNAYGWSIAKCAEVAGVTEIRVRFRVKLLNLRQDIQSLVRTGNLPIGYAQILSDANLDTNRQILAVVCLRENPKPTTGWFRSIVNKYAEQQSTVSLFDSPLLSCQTYAAPSSTPAEPPHPYTSQPPSIGSNLREILDSQVEFWKQAAQQWVEIGKPFKSQECRAAATALSYIPC